MTSPSDIKGLVESVLIDAAQIIDTAKREWSAEGQWSEWDQGVRDRITQALASISSREEEPRMCPACYDPKDGAAERNRKARDCEVCGGSCRAPAIQAEPEDARDIEAIKKAAYKQGWNDREGDFLTGVARICPAPATQAEREAVERLRWFAAACRKAVDSDDEKFGDYINGHDGDAAEDIDCILSLLESRRTPPDPRPLTALLTRWDNGESVGDLITQYLRGEGDWGPVRVLVENRS